MPTVPKGYKVDREVEDYGSGSGGIFALQCPIAASLRFDQKEVRCDRQQRSALPLMIIHQPSTDIIFNLVFLSEDYR